MSLTKFHTRVGKELVDDTVTEIVNGSITIKDGAITNDKVADSAITNDKVADSAITTNKVADSAITGVKIADNTILYNKLDLSDSIVDGDIASAAAIDGSKFADNTILYNKLDLSDSIVDDDIASAAAIDGSKFADGTVTKAKIEDINDMKVLGNTSGAIAAPSEVSILDEDDMNSDSSTALATQQSIKSYVDKLKPNIVQAVKTDTFEKSNADNAWIDIPDMSVTITPKFDNSKILVQTMISSNTNNANHGVMFRLIRDTYNIATGTGLMGSRTKCSFVGGGYNNAYGVGSSGIDYLDESTLIAAGTAVTYKVQCTADTTVSLFINRSHYDYDEAESPRPISTLTVTEIYQ